MLGKSKCKILKEIRAQIAAANDIAYVIEECGYKGNCKGTCPKCEQEVLYLEQELEKRRRLGKKVAVAGVAGTLAVSMTGIVSGCQMQEVTGETLEGDVSTTYYQEEIMETQGSAPMPVESEEATEEQKEDTKVETTEEQKEDTQVETTEEIEESTEETQELEGDVAVPPVQLG